MTTKLLLSYRRFSFTNWLYLRLSLRREASIRRQPKGATNYSVVKRNAITATWSRYGATRDGTCTLPRKSASIAFKRTGRPIIDIGLHQLVIYLPTRREAFIMTAVSSPHGRGGSLRFLPFVGLDR